ncbi:hypothetical protein Glove_123g24 [Diversispora epigaea]|uniref:Uncharacterized protein n=1 Tax=Diversispora epigaea TaxID=1348612 RepID=A0A397J7Y8_9GLOM|nr:hypothetical protein Glove_123g24 [Diversispora epigaea]
MSPITGEQNLLDPQEDSETCYKYMSIIEYSEPGRSYTYEIIEEGQYPSITYLKYTKGNIFRIPNNYKLKTNDYQDQVKFNKSCSDVANLYAQKTIKKKTQYSGPHLFGLHLEILQQSRDACRRVTVLKPFDNLTPTGQNNRAKQITKSVCNIFNQIAIEKCHPEDNPKLKSIELDIKNKSYQISIGKENTEEIIHKAKATVQACNKAERNTITIEMNKFIPIFLINLTPLQFDESVNSEIHIDDLEIINNIQESIGKGGRRNIIDILKFLIPNLLKQKILNISNPEIHLRISGDGRNVGRKVKLISTGVTLNFVPRNNFVPRKQFRLLVKRLISTGVTLNFVPRNNFVPRKQFRLPV